MATLPMAIYGLEVPAGDIAIPAKPDIPAAFRITMAAIDPSAEPEESGVTPANPPRATLKIIREPLLAGFDDEDEEDDSDFDPEEMDRILAGGGDDEEESEDDEEANGGPSDPAKSKKSRKHAVEEQLRRELAGEMEVDLPNGVTGKGKGKKAGEDVDEDDDDDEEDSEEDDDDESIDELEEFVICTLDPQKNYQQTLDITVGDDERVWFKVSGTHTIYLTGNYVEVADHNHGPDEYDEDDYDEDDYDLSPSEDDINDYLGESESEDELDDIDDPRITEVDSDVEEAAPALVPAVKKSKKADEKKGKNKRTAEDSIDESTTSETLDDLISKASKPVAKATNGDEKLSKKQAKKLKNNAGEAVAATADKSAKKEDVPSSAKSDKKVQFAEKLEQGPTPSPSQAKTTDKAKSAITPSTRTVQGVTIEDRKVGTGPAAKAGNKVGMRYIGKLKDGKQFDANKKGKPFSFKLGSGDVIKGWDIGVAGMAVGGERRITVPAHLAYGSKNLPGIPANSTLIFDLKLLEVGGK